jgi:spermidine synthase
MRQPWVTVEAVDTPDGKLMLQQRGRDSVITIAGRVLMSTAHTRSEVVVAELGCAPIRTRPRPRVLVSGLGLGFTLRAALDVLPRTAEVTVAELNGVVVQWCRGPAASAAGDTLADPRVKVVVGDVTDEIRRIAGDPSAPRLDAIVLDLYLGPPEPPARGEDPLYGSRILRASHAALGKGGVLAVWGETRSPSYESRMRGAGFHTRWVRPKGGGPRHVVHLGTK